MRHSLRHSAVRIGPWLLIAFAGASFGPGCSSSDTHQQGPPLTSGSGSGGGGTGGSGSGAHATTTGTGNTGGHCGNDVRDGTEQCDGPDLNTQDCVSLGFASGTLKCGSDCKFDTSGCVGKENCEDGVDNDGDGKIDCLDSSCQAACATACTDLPALVDDDGATVTGITDGHTIGAAPSCASSAGAGPETAYTFTAAHTGYLTARLTPHNAGSGPPNLVLSVRRQCTDVSTEVACDNENSGSSVLVVDGLAVTQGDTFAIVVDGFSASDHGAYQLSVGTHTQVCGDGHKDPGEQCDDGNMMSGDGCSSSCTVEITESEPNDTRGTADPYSAPWFGQIQPASDVDCVSIVATAQNQQLVAEIDDLDNGACAAGLIDSYLTVYDGGGTQIASDDDSGDGLCSRVMTGMELVNGDTYTVCVSAGASNPAAFYYQLVVTLQ
jgi:cysteine-rich repeat protein